jgi:uncharacterized protein YjbI with pentapeptide repeats
LIKSDLIRGRLPVNLLHGVDLNGIDLSNANLEGVNKCRSLPSKA